MRTAELLDTKTSTVPAQETEQAQPRQATPDTLRGQFMKVASDIIGAPDYIEYLKMVRNPNVRKVISEQELKSKKARAIGNAALRLAEAYPEEKYKQRDIAKLMSAYPGWVMAEQRKKDEEKGFLDNRVYNHHGRRIRQQNTERFTEFNHALREVIDDWGATTSLQELIHSMHMIHPYRTDLDKPENLEEKKEFYKSITATVRGIRNEIAFEHVLIRAGVDFEPATAEEDARGVDYYINGKPVDVKASIFAAQEALQKIAERGRSSDTIIFYPGISDSDFDGKLTLPQANPDRVAELQPKIIRRMRSAGII
mgnify:CR=1 FL=1